MMLTVHFTLLAVLQLPCTSYATLYGGCCSKPASSGKSSCGSCRGGRMPGSAGPLGMGCPGTRGCGCVPGIPGTPGTPGLMGPSGKEGPRGNDGARGPVGPVGSKGDKGEPGAQGGLGSSGIGSWKQCVFKNLNEGKDNGLIKECVFEKRSNDTGLRVFWNGALRIYNCNFCCKRWYFTFNDAECYAPEAIDGIVFMKTGGRPNDVKSIHRVRQIEGVCETVSKGTVRVGFWVGNCDGFGDADAYTGWKSVSRIYVEEVPPPQH